MEDTTKILLQIFLAFAGARLLGWAFQAVKQPAIIGELMAGAILGPALLNLVHQSEFLEALGELGVILLLFTAGLDTHLEQLASARTTAAKVAVLGAALPFAGGLAGGLAFRYATGESLFLGTALMATSVGITVRVLRDLGYHRRRSVTIILGAAVLDDVLGLIVLGLVTALALGETNTLELVLLAVEAVVFVGGIGFIGPHIVSRFGARLAKLSANTIFELGIIVMLALSLLANYIGLAAIVGAFIAGLLVSRAQAAHGGGEQVHAARLVLRAVLLRAHGHVHRSHFVRQAARPTGDRRVHRDRRGDQVHRRHPGRQERG